MKAVCHKDDAALNCRCGVIAMVSGVVSEVKQDEMFWQIADRMKFVKKIVSVL